MSICTGRVREIYNTMDEVISADKALNKLNKEGILDELSTIVLRHRLESHFGIRLLHKHNEINDGELMIERPECLVDGRDCLTTMATNAPFSSSDMYPNSWRLVDGAMEAIEYSVDPLVCGNHISSERVGVFFEEFGAVLHRLQVETLLGPCVIPRQFHSKKPNGAILVEETDEDRRANIVAFSDPSTYNAVRLIDATWVVKSPGSTEIVAGCGTHCASGGSCVPHSACVIAGDGSHSSQSHHSSGGHIAQHYQTGG